MIRQNSVILFILLFLLRVGTVLSDGIMNSTFYNYNGETKVAELLSIESDTIFIRIHKDDWPPYEKKINKSAISRIVLPDGQELIPSQINSYIADLHTTSEEGEKQSGVILIVHEQDTAGTSKDSLSEDRGHAAEPDTSSASIANREDPSKETASPQEKQSPEKKNEASGKPSSAERASQTADTDKETTDIRDTGDHQFVITSEPSGGTVYIDDQEMSAPTPLGLDSIKAGPHVVRIIKENLVAAEGVIIEEGKPSALHLTLQPQSTELELRSTPHGARLRIEADRKRLRGRYQTPVVLRDLSADTIQVTFRHKNHADTTVTTALQKQLTNIIQISLPSLPSVARGKNRENDRLSVSIGDSADLSADTSFPEEAKPATGGAKKGKPRLGLSISVPSVLCMIGGGFFGVLANRDYEEAQNKKDYLSKSLVAGTKYYDTKEKNESLATSAQNKSYIAVGLGGIGLLGTVIGLTITF